MATYKIIQDVEAEDKFVGPLTLKQFILAGVTVVMLFICYFLISRHVWFLTVPLLPFMFLTGFLAFPWGRDQPTEVWLLAKLRFMLKPRRRIWDQTGAQQLVTITAPKKAVEQFIGNGLSQTEVRSRLRALANTIDSRGWAVKNVNVNLYADPSYAQVTLPASDRLTEGTSIQRDMPNVDVQAADDILDERNNPTAQNLDKMIADSTKTHRQETMHKLDAIRDRMKPSAKPKTGKSKQDTLKAGSKDTTTDDKPVDFYFMHDQTVSKSPAGYSTFGSQTVQPGSDDDDTTTAGPLTADEQKLLAKAHKQDQSEPAAYGNTKVVEPLDAKHQTHHKTNVKGKKPSPKPPKTTPKQAVTDTPDPAILGYANNDDLTVATIARQAKKDEPQAPNNEVVISLH